MHNFQAKTPGLDEEACMTSTHAAACQIFLSGVTEEDPLLSELPMDVAHWRRTGQ
jgi:hypothetical protein